MPLRVAVMADLHGRLPPVPSCDVLVLAGDICPDISYRVSFNDPDIMRNLQMEWMETEFYAWQHLWPKDVRICLATPGNHDWINRFPDKVQSASSAPPATLHIDELVETYGKKFYFTPWVTWCGDWNYQLDRGERKQRFDAIPHKVDLLVAHSPAFGVGDMAWGDSPAGCRELRDAIQTKQPKYVVFGHIHEGQRYGREFRLGGSKLYHASMWGDNWKPVEFTL